MVAHVIRGVPRPEPDLVRRFERLSAATVYEAAGQVGAMNHDIRPLALGMRVCGPALTVWCPPGDNLMLHKAVSVAQPGDVLVADVGGCLEGGSWGEILTIAARERGIAGLVSNGSVRDVGRLLSLEFPVFCRGVSMKGTTKKKLGRVNHPVWCGGVCVRPGDLVIGDDDGVVVVARERIRDVLQLAVERVEREEEILKAVREGRNTVEVLGLEEVLAAEGVLEE
jgi:4-hydroxy-4-methyl-2-oxoglutarate aldolase